MLKTTILLGMISFLTLSACAVNRQRYETAPVRMQTTQGEVLCQLYTVNIVMWDEAISVPPHMPITTGNRICRNEGLRLRAVRQQGL